MANITVQVPDALLPRIQAAVSATQGYQAQVPDPQDPTLTKTIPNPETIAQFTQRLLRDYLKNIVVGHEASQVQQTEANRIRGEFG